MTRKSFIVTSVFVLAVLVFSSFGGLIVSAWSTSNLTTVLSNTTCKTSPGCTVGTSLTDSATITVTSETCGTCYYGTVTFQIYAGTCSSYSGSALSGFTTGSATESTVSVPSSLSSGSATVSSATFSTSGLTGTSYVWIVNYVSGGVSGESWPSYGPTCESMYIQQPTHGVPEFPLGSLGMAALIGMMIPLLFVMRSRFAKNLPL